MCRKKLYRIMTFTTNFQIIKFDDQSVMQIITVNILIVNGNKKSQSYLIFNELSHINEKYFSASYDPKVYCIAHG